MDLMLRVGLFVMATCLAAVPLLGSQQLPDASLRAAFLFNFARFTEWPAAALPPDGPLVICTDDQAVFDALRGSFAGKSTGKHLVATARLAEPGGAGRCHVAYLRRVPAAGAERLFADLSGAHVLTVGDDAAALRAGAVVHFFVEDRRLRFAVSLPNMSRAGLQLSSRLLSLAVIHRAPPETVRDGTPPGTTRSSSLSRVPEEGPTGT